MTIKTFSNCIAIFSVLILLGITGCQNEHNSQNPNVQDLEYKNIKKYLLTGHTYSWLHRFKVDKRIEELAKMDFDGFWLGGDVLSETTLNNKFIYYLDSVFNLKNPMTHIAYGNHDARNGNKRFFNEFRNRPDSYYTHYQDGLCFLILDSTLNPADCNSLDDQYDLIVNVCDTISAASHLMVLIHDSVWEGIPGIPKPEAYAHGSQKYWNANCQSSENTFTKSIYPLLKKVKEKNIEVICMMGDTGWKKGGEYVSTDGIHFISSGINNSYYLKNDPDNQKIKKDMIFVFTHDMDNQKLDWEYLELNSLVKVEH